MTVSMGEAGSARKPSAMSVVPYLPSLATADGGPQETASRAALRLYPAQVSALADLERATRFEDAPVALRG